MAKIQPSLKLKLEIVNEDNKVERIFNVTYKELSKKQEREIGKENKDILDLFKKSQELSKMVKILESEVEAHKELNKPKELLASTKELKKLYLEQDELDSKFEDLGGFDRFIEASKITFESVVTGGDKDALREFAENESDFGQVLTALAEDAKESRGKRY
jgi:hypothetical protein